MVCVTRLFLPRALFLGTFVYIGMHIFLTMIVTAHLQDRCIDGLRDTLATTKRSYEGRVAQLEEALGSKTAQVWAFV